MSPRSWPDTISIAAYFKRAFSAKYIFFSSRSSQSSFCLFLLLSVPLVLGLQHSSAVPFIQAVSKEAADNLYQGVSYF